MKFFKENWVLSMCIICLLPISLLDFSLLALAQTLATIATLMLFYWGGRFNRLGQLRWANLSSSMAGIMLIAIIFFFIKYLTLDSYNTLVVIINSIQLAVFITILAKARIKK